MKIMVNGKEIANIITNRSMTIAEAMYCAGWDVNDEADCREGYENGVEGFCLDDDGYWFDVEAAEMVY